MFCNKLGNSLTALSSFLSSLCLGFWFHGLPLMDFVGDGHSESVILSIHWLNHSGFFLPIFLSLILFFRFFLFLPVLFYFPFFDCMSLFFGLMFLFYKMCRVLILISLEHISFVFWWFHLAYGVFGDCSGVKRLNFRCSCGTPWI